MFVSTSEKTRVAADFAIKQGPGFVYDIQMKPNAVDINRSYKGVRQKNKQWGWEKEHAFIGGVGWRQVRGWRPVVSHREESYGIEFPAAGDFVPNPDYDTRFDKFKGAKAQPQLFAQDAGVSMRDQVSKIMASPEAREAKAIGGDHFAPSFCALSKKRDAACVPKFGASDEQVYRSKWGAAEHGPPGAPPGVVDEDAVKTPEEADEEAKKKPQPEDAAPENGPEKAAKPESQDAAEKPRPKTDKDAPSKPPPEEPRPGAVGEQSPKERLKTSKLGPNLGKTLALTGLLKLTTGVMNTAVVEAKSGNETDKVKEFGRVTESVLRANTVNYDEAASSLKGCSLFQTQPPAAADASVVGELARGFMNSMRCHWASLEYLARNAPLSGEVLANLDKGAAENEAFLQAHPNASFAESLAHVNEMRSKFVVGTIMDLMRGFIPGFTEVEDNVDKAVAAYKEGAAQGKAPDAGKLLPDMWAGVLTDLKNNYIPLDALANEQDPAAKAAEALESINLDEEMKGLGEAGQKLIQVQNKISQEQKLGAAEDDFWTKLEEAERAARTELRAGRRGDGAKAGAPSAVGGGGDGFDQKMQALVEASRKVTELDQAAASSGEVKAAEGAFLAQANEAEKAASAKLKAFKQGA